MGELALIWGLPAFLVVCVGMVIVGAFGAATKGTVGTFNPLHPMIGFWERLWMFFMYLVLALALWASYHGLGVLWSTIQKQMWTRDNPVQTVGYELHRFRLVDQRPPKHYRVQLLDLEANSYHWVSVSKHCNSWRDNKIGDEYNIMMTIKEQAGKRWLVYPSLNPIFC